MFYLFFFSLYKTYHVKKQTKKTTKRQIWESLWKGQHLCIVKDLEKDHGKEENRNECPSAAAEHVWSQTLVFGNTHTHTYDRRRRRKDQLHLIDWRCVRVCVQGGGGCQHPESEVTLTWKSILSSPTGRRGSFHRSEWHLESSPRPNRQTRW